MIINFIQNSMVANNSTMYKRRIRSSLIALSHDVVSFGKAVNVFDFACARKFKLNQNTDFKDWVKANLTEYFNLDQYEGRNNVITDERKRILKEWKDCLEEENNIYIKNPALSLIIFSSIVSDLRKGNDKLPPSLDKYVLSATVKQLEEILEKNKRYRFNFCKMYQNNLKTYYLQDEKLNNQDSPVIQGWVRIPSKINDPDNFDKNVEKAKALSYKSWCTKNAEPREYMSKGDFYIYFEDGQPKIIMIFVGDEISEIQGERNNGAIPLEYLDEIKRFIDKNGFRGSEVKIKQAQMAKLRMEEIRSSLRKSIAEKDYKTILEYLGFKVKILEDNSYEISEYKQPHPIFTFKDLGIDERDLFKNISRINGNADFRGSQIMDLGILQSIAGNADFRGSQIISLGSLRSIYGNANFRHCQITSIGNLQLMGGYADFRDSKIKDWSKAIDRSRCLF